MSHESYAADFLEMHNTGPGFVMPNAWDTGSAIILAASGFPAIATTSSGIAFSLGKQDYPTGDSSLNVSKEEMFARIAEMVKSVKIPVNGDLEAGYGDEPEAIAETVQMAIEAGLAGGNIEDKIPFKTELYDETLAVERILAAREKIDAMNSSFVLTARCDAIVWCENGVEEAIRRSNLYRDAGADCLFTPSPTDIQTITTLAKEINGPLNMVMGLGSADGNVREWLASGVQRISLGGSIARAALGFVQHSMKELQQKGTITFAEMQIQQPDLNRLFGEYHSVAPGGVQ
ncbi:MAG: isocitrate lyase/PEP mutase family protein [Methyloligellaceae bacterium]